MWGLGCNGLILMASTPSSVLKSVAVCCRKLRNKWFLKWFPETQRI
jgi:hypothetical protein